MPGRNPNLPEVMIDSRKHYTKADIAARKENTPEIDSAKMRAPAWLDDIAKKEWRRIVRLAKHSGIYTDLDVNTLGMYCMNYSRVVQAYKEYKDQSERVAAEHDGRPPLVYKGQLNPYLAVAMKAEEQCRKLSAILGLDPVSRARMGLARKNAIQPVDPLEELLNEFVGAASGGKNV